MRYAVKTAPPPSGEPDEFVLSDGGIDRMGDVIEPSGWVVDKMQTTALFAHDSKSIVGKWTNVRVKGDRLIGKLVWDESGKSPLVEHLRALVKQGILRTVSVGFRSLKSEPLDEADEFGGLRFLKQELLECSLVAVPANPRAVALVKSLGMPSDITALIFRKSASEETPDRGKSAKSTASRETKMPGTLGQRIKAAHDNYNALRERLIEITSAEDQTDEDIQRADELPDEIAQAKQLLERLQRQERALMPIGQATEDRQIAAPMIIEHKATPQQQQQQPEIKDVTPFRAPFAMPKKNTDPQQYIYRALACWGASLGSRDPIEKVLRDRLDKDPDREMVNMVLRAAANPAMTTVAGWAAELVQTINVGFLDRLLPNSIYPVLAAAGNRYTFNGVGTLKIPVRTTASQLAGAWVGEAAAKPVKKASFSSVTLTPFKLAVISTFTEEMAQYSTPTIEGIIQQAMQNDTAISLDSFLIDANASSSSRPAGLLFGVTPITASAATATADKIIADMKALAGAIIAAGGGSNIIYLMNPAQALSLASVPAANGVFMFDSADAAAAKFQGRLLTSLTVPAGRLIAIDAAEFATATGDTPRFAVSNEATLHEEDTTPLALSASGTPNTVAAPMRSLFQTDAIAIRLSLYVTWAMRRTGLVQTIASVTW